MTAGEQVEKVAKALFAWDTQEHEDPRPTWEGSEGLREVFRSGAAVAIAAMQPTPQADVLAEVRAWASGIIRPDRPLNPIASYGAEIAARQVIAILDKHEAKS